MVAAGSGSRLGAAVPKALVPIAGVSLLRRSLTQLAAGGAQQAIVVVPADEVDALYEEGERDKEAGRLG